MSRYIDVKGSEISFTAANNVNQSTFIRVYAAANSTVTVANTGGTIGTFTMPAGSVEYIKKSPTDTIAGSTTLNCSPVAII